MNVLVLNSGSSSLKYQLINMNTEEVVIKGICERIGMEKSTIKHDTKGNDTIIIDKEIKNHKSALQEVLKLIGSKKVTQKQKINIDAVGHRIAHGGENFSDSVLINEKVINAIKDCIELAPLHNPSMVLAIEACVQLLKGIPMVAVFDTSFHQTLPKHAYIYPLPYELYERYGIRKYGFHGTSHEYVGLKAAELLNEPMKDLKIITCHLGNGASMCAIKDGKSVETSMGFTPLEGLAMGTRSGNIDPSILHFLEKKDELTSDQVNEILNKKSGVFGISGISSDFRDLQKEAQKGNERAKLALEIFSYRVKQLIGSYAAIMGGLDCIVFTAGIGENSSIIRKKVLKGLEYMGIVIDSEKNENTLRGTEKEISACNSKVRVLVIPTNEELKIAREVMKILNKYN